MQACLAALPLLLKASAASADDFGPPATKGIGIAEVVVLASPLLLYGELLSVPGAYFFSGISTCQGAKSASILKI